MKYQFTVPNINLAINCNNPVWFLFAQGVWHQPVLHTEIWSSSSLSGRTWRDRTNWMRQTKFKRTNVWKCKLIFPTDTPFLQQKIEITDSKNFLAAENISFLTILAKCVCVCLCVCVCVCVCVCRKRLVEFHLMSHTTSVVPFSQLLSTP